MAASATLHCLSGCAVGEISRHMMGTAISLSAGWTIALAVTLAFFLGYLLSTLPLVKTGLGLGAALSVVFAADTLSIAVMEIGDNAMMALIPNAMDAGLVNWLFWVGMALALTVAFFAAYLVNRYLLQRGKGHALTHQYHHAPGGEATGARRYIPPSPPRLSSRLLRRSCSVDSSSPSQPKPTEARPGARTHRPIARWTAHPKGSLAMGCYSHDRVSVRTYVPPTSWVRLTRG